MDALESPVTVIQRCNGAFPEAPDVYEDDSQVAADAWANHFEELKKLGPVRGPQDEALATAGEAEQVWLIRVGDAVVRRWIMGVH